MPASIKPSQPQIAMILLACFASTACFAAWRHQVAILAESERLHGRRDQILLAMDAFESLKPILVGERSIGWASDSNEDPESVKANAIHNMAQYALTPVVLEPPTGQRYVLIAASDHDHAAAYLFKHDLRPVKALNASVLLAERQRR